MGLFDRFRRVKVALQEQGPLYPAVRDAMAEVQAYARSHGGEIELVSVDEAGCVTIRLGGTCRGCPLSAITVKAGVEQRLKAMIPGIEKIVQL